MTVPLRVKLATGKPKPELAKPLPAIVKLAGGATKSKVLGVIEFTEGGEVVLLTVSDTLPTKLQPFDPVWL